jgi:rhodanese-related sulfurtransferase
MLKSLNWKPTLREALWIVALSLVLACGTYLIRPDVIPGASDEPVESDDAVARSIDFEAAVDHFKKRTAIFADARPLPAFAAGHIEGALHLDPNAFDQWSGQIVSSVPLDATILTYCEGDQCELSRDLAEKLTWLGFEKVYYLIDGWGRWQKQGLPSEKGDGTLNAH